jgi:hypothetical protein
MALPITKELIAPCGMNCAVCRGHLLSKNPCDGCRKITESEPVSRFSCKMRICDERKNDYCFYCKEFPCQRLRQLDKRYSTKYGLSEIENLEIIRDQGIRKFLKKENERWVKGNEIFCVHDKQYYRLKSNKFKDTGI